MVHKRTSRADDIINVAIFWPRSSRSARLYNIDAYRAIKRRYYNGTLNCVKPSLLTLRKNIFFQENNSPNKCAKGTVQIHNVKRSCIQAFSATYFYKHFDNHPICLALVVLLLDRTPALVILLVDRHALVVPPLERGCSKERALLERGCFTGRVWPGHVCSRCCITRHSRD